MGKRSITFIMDGNFIYFDNCVYSPHMHYQAFASRYSDGFDKVCIYSRAFNKEKATGFPVAKNNVVFVRAPSNRGLKSYILNFWSVLKSVSNQVKEADILMLRFPGNLAIIAMFFCLIQSRKFCVEVVAEPKDYFTKENGFGRLYWIYRLIHCNATKFAVKKAKIVRYVTSNYLQKNYPAQIEKSFGFTDVYLGNLGTVKKKLKVPLITNKIVNVAMMHNDSKGHINLIESCMLLKEKGINIYISFIGDGARREYYESLVKQFGLENQIVFHGIVSGGPSLTSKILEADLFVLPSSQEGMPRSLLEAMYLHMPCLATNVGGIPELFPENTVISPNNTQILADRIEELFTQEGRLCDLQQTVIESIENISEKNLAMKYSDYISALVNKG